LPLDNSNTAAETQGLARSPLKPYDAQLMHNRTFLGNAISQGFCAEDNLEKLQTNMYQYQSQSPTRDLRSEDLFAGIAKHYPIRTHLQFAAYLVLLSLFVVYIFVNPWNIPNDPSGHDIGFKSKLDASIHTFFCPPFLWTFQADEKRAQNTKETGG